MNIDYTLWPNADGQLGQNKVTIPDGETVQWPDGDAIVGNFVYKDGLLSGFVDTKALIVNESKSTTFPYDYVNITVDKSLEGIMTFNQGERTKYLTITYTESGNSGDTIVLGTKYIDCTTAEEVRGVDDKYYINDVKDGVWSESLPNLTTASFQWFIGGGDGPGETLFENCDNLIIFNSDLSSLTDGCGMFRDCDNLTSFNANLFNLEYGDYMFDGCTALTSFNANLSSLQNGDMMFRGCKLDAHSIKNMIDTISADVVGLTLGIGCNATTEDKDLFAQEAGYADMASLIEAFYNNVFHVIGFRFNGRPASSYSLRRPEGNTLPVFVKLEEVEKYAEYTSEDGSKNFRLKWFHETTGSTEDYTQYATLEEAVEALNIKPIEKH